MDVLVACASLIFVAAITPGPNNFAVLRIAVARGLHATLPAMGGILVGGLAMLALGQVGLAALSDAHSKVRIGVAVCGAAYLVWLGLALVWHSFSTTPTSARSDAPDGALALFAFQFANPKSWTLALTVSAAIPPAGDGAGRYATTAALVALFIAIPFVCLIAWAAFGRLVAPILRNARARARFDRAMGVVLAASAVALLIQQSPAGVL